MSKTEQTLFLTASPWISCSPTPNNLMFLSWLTPVCHCFGFFYYTGELQAGYSIPALCWCTLVSWSVSWLKETALYTLKVEDHSLGNFKFWARTGIDLGRLQLYFIHYQFLQLNFVFPVLMWDTMMCASVCPVSEGSGFNGCRTSIYFNLYLNLSPGCL